MEKTIRNRIGRHDSVTEYHDDEDQRAADSELCNEADGFEDGQEAAVRICKNNEIVALRLMWFTPSLKQPPAQFDHTKTTFVHFNPILWPVQPRKCTVDVSNHMLSTGSRGPGSWRRMLVASASQCRFGVMVKVEGCRVAFVQCDASVTVGKLLDLARHMLGTRDGLGLYYYDDDGKTAEEQGGRCFCPLPEELPPMGQRCEYGRLRMDRAVFPVLAGEREREIGRNMQILAYWREKASRKTDPKG
ncbi:uncharacterized protein SEPMUDRAFT_158231 [Sphaerulina musiva SO2202]|uniref:Uncharacterized protein n=1 Tax=Sphaerulina musiva (strain SO2202) TaxID=692275 RepID=M3CCC5_SPHMS|nr:uncharacterized protein SEPMUDRAFT_158231 [Sphaerulina musiva SO2202]EMF10032.1 hypothetical protein SEPMUDRAFT_158231 [Sphaerulina musiva SO2202]